MDDLGAAISGFLEQPGAMEQLEAMAKQLGLGPSGTGADAQEAESQEVAAPAIAGLSPEKLGPLMAAFSGGGMPTAETALLDALRPFLGEDSQEKLDRAKRALGLMRTVRTVAGTMIE